MRKAAAESNSSGAMPCFWGSRCPSEVMDDTGQWTAPLVVADDHEVGLMIPDVSSPVWLKKNYRDFIDKHQYVVTMFTFHKSPEACKANQIGWGNSDAASMNACTLDIGYRMRQARVDTHLKTVTLLSAAIVGHDGEIVPSTKIEPRMDRTWASLDANSQAALEKTSQIVSKQMKAYDLKVQSRWPPAFIGRIALLLGVYLNHLAVSGVRFKYEASI